MEGLTQLLSMLGQVQVRRFDKVLIEVKIIFIGIVITQLLNYYWPIITSSVPLGLLNLYLYIIYFIFDVS